MAKCPVCAKSCEFKWNGTPYWMCRNCDTWFQSPIPATPFGGSGSGSMDDNEKLINKNLANNLFTRFFNETPGRVLDVGAAYPYFSHTLQRLGCTAYGVDGSADAQKNYDDLGVQLLHKSFEDLNDQDVETLTADGKFHMVSMIHMFERSKDPITTIRNCRKLLADDGILYLRMLDHTVGGFDEAVGVGHAKSHPFLHSLPSILEVLVQTQDQFVVVWNEGLDGAGQRDVVLKAITKRPMIWAGMIVKNEERDLPRCLNSIKEVVDGLVLVDTGSVDNTLLVAQSSWTKAAMFETYTDASKQDETGDWKLWDFSKARNVYVDLIDQIPHVDYLLWMDADDELLTPNSIRRAVYLNEYEIFGINIETGGMKWVHHRMWKTRKGIKYGGRIHEYPDFGGKHGITLMDCSIRHDAAPGIGENSNQRNLRILEAEFAEEPTSRCAFYLANTHKDAGRWEEAVKYYKVRIGMGEHYQDEWLFAYLYRARCERAAKLVKDAENTLLEALSKAPNWSEFWMELAYMSFDAGDWQRAAGYCLEANARTSEYTQLWREPNMYTDQPLRLLSFCAENQGDKAAALGWALKAKEAIGVSDVEWNQRIMTLQGVAPVKAETNPAPVNQMVQQFLAKKGPKPKIALNRPGAIGDIIMILNLIPMLKQKYPKHQIDFFCHPTLGENLKGLMSAAGIEEIRDFEKLQEFRMEYDQIYNMVGYPLAEGYPERPMRKHLLEFFADELGLQTDPQNLPYLLLPRGPLPQGAPKRFATLHAQAGWSVYKNWSFKRWQEVLAQCPDIPVFQIGAATDFKIEGADHRFMGTELQTSISLMAHADMHMGVDSFTNHLTNIKWKNKGKTPSVILWGSTQWNAAGYRHNTNLSLGLECQPCFREDPRISRMSRGPCVNPPNQIYENPCHACMEGISTEQVLEAIRATWKG